MSTLAVQNTDYQQSTYIPTNFQNVFIDDFKRDEISKYFTSEFIQALEIDLWGTIAQGIRDNFDDTGTSESGIYALSVYCALQHRSFNNNNNKLLNNNAFSWLLRDISYSLISALKHNNKSLCPQLEYLMAIARRINFNTVLLTIRYTPRFNMAIDLLSAFQKCYKISRHWIHQSLSIQGLIWRFCKAIDKIYRVYITQNRKNPKHEISQRIIQLFYKKNRICVKYLNQVFQTCMQHQHCSNNTNCLLPTNYKIVQKYGSIEASKLTTCGNKKCNKSYNEYKYDKEWNEILSIVSSRLDLPTKRKWYKCSACKIQYYCCRKCQKYDWKYNHRNYCKNYY